jgi:hypothetical protein
MVDASIALGFLTRRALLVEQNWSASGRLSEIVISLLLLEPATWRPDLENVTSLADLRHKTGAKCTRIVLIEPQPNERVQQSGR